ncbi:hypothetical protein D3C71_1763800 [compost metagenome]
MIEQLAIRFSDANSSGNKNAIRCNYAIYTKGLDFLKLMLWRTVGDKSNNCATAL